VLDVDQARKLLDSIDTSSRVGLCDRALIGLMVYSFVRVGAAVAMCVEDYYQDGKCWTFRLHEKGGNPPSGKKRRPRSRKLSDSPKEKAQYDAGLSDLIHAGLITPQVGVERTFKVKSLMARIERDSRVRFGQRHFRFAFDCRRSGPRIGRWTA